MAKEGASLLGLSVGGPVDGRVVVDGVKHSDCRIAGAQGVRQVDGQETRRKLSWDNVCIGPTFAAGLVMLAFEMVEIRGPPRR